MNYSVCLWETLMTHRTKNMLLLLPLCAVLLLTGFTSPVEKSYQV